MIKTIINWHNANYIWNVHNISLLNKVMIQFYNFKILIVNFIIIVIACRSARRSCTSMASLLSLPPSRWWSLIGSASLDWWQACTDWLWWACARCKSAKCFGDFAEAAVKLPRFCWQSFLKFAVCVPGSTKYTFLYCSCFLMNLT